MRTNRRSSSLASWSVLLAATPIAAQSTLLVGPGGLPQIRDALAAAAPGDVIEVLPGTYAQFTCAVGVTIRAAVAGTVSVQVDAAVLPPGCLFDSTCYTNDIPTRFAPPSGGQVHVVGIRFLPNWIQSGLNFFHHRVEVSSGTVTFDDCSIEATQTSALRVHDASVHMQSCVVTASGGGVVVGISAANARVVAIDCSITAEDAPTLSGIPGIGVSLNASLLHATGCSFTGGTLAGFGSGPGLFADAASRVWISDSTLTPGGSNGCAVTGTPAVGQMARTTLNGAGTNCGVLVPAPLAGVERLAPVQNGAPFSISVRTEPNAPVVFHASQRLGYFDLPAWFAQPTLLDVSSAFVAGWSLADANGDLTASWNMPAGQFVDETVWVEPMVLLPTAVVVGPPVGGLIH